MKIITLYEPPPIPDRRWDWIAYDDDTYGGEPGDPVGRGRTEREAVEDFLERVDRVSAAAPRTNCMTDKEPKS